MVPLYIYFSIFIVILLGIHILYSKYEPFSNNTNIEPTLTFLTFGSHDNYIRAGKRLIKEVESLNIFHETILYTSDDLKYDDNFWNKHQTFVNDNKRGYGYWLWKPYIIKKTMEKMKDGDILLYLDCGCEINSDEKDYLNECIKNVKRDKIIGTTTQIEGNWNKMDLILKLDMNKYKYLNTPQRQGGAILFLVCDETIGLVNHWYNLACDYHNIDDTKSVAANLHGFKEHRHDQSIFSLLTKKYNLYSDINLDYKCIKASRKRDG